MFLCCRLLRLRCRGLVILYCHIRIYHRLRAARGPFGGPSKEGDIEDQRFIRRLLHETRILREGGEEGHNICERFPVMWMGTRVGRDGKDGKLTVMKFLMVKSSVKEEETFWSWLLSWARRDIISSSAELRMARVLTAWQG